MDLAVKSILRPKFFEDALTYLADDPSIVPVAGGTDLVVQLRAGHRKAKRLLDISAVTSKAISVTGETLEIGAGATMDTIAQSEAVRCFCPGLSEAAAQVGAWPIQCRATLGGNLANASPAADTVPPLLASGATVITASTRGERRIPICKFFTGPGQTVIKDRELIRAIEIPYPPPNTVSLFKKLGWRREQVISVVSLAIQLTFDSEKRVSRAAVALGSVAPTPIRAPSSENFLTGQILTPETRLAASSAVQGDISPIDDVRSPAWYRRLAAKVLLSRLLERAANV
ncbi:MAG: xanthine dehydrogenase family protein subunit M [Thermoanaerobaculales bacterium]|nr:xanthine dehydrogenase family protein subunit M [Thermoanaerobaculales bacterium]